jgi:hypothetical protein
MSAHADLPREILSPPRDTATARYLLVVSRASRDLYDYLLQQLAEDPDAKVEIVLDRRSGDRRRRDLPVALERRMGQRRQHPEVDDQLRAQSVVVVKLP